MDAMESGIPDGAPLPTDPGKPVCVVSHRVDGEWREVRRFNRYVKPASKDDPVPPAVVDTPLP